MSNYANPEATEAKKAAAGVYQNTGESMVSATDPEAAQQFAQAKKLYGQLSPVADASARRAAQLNQHPFGGLTDAVSYGAGGVPGVIAKRVIAPRFASSAAAGADMVSQLLTNAPQVLGRFAAPLQAAASRGPQALAASHYVLQQQDQEYRERINHYSNPDQQEDKDSVQIKNNMTNNNDPAQ